jgi:protein SCO1/2
MVKRHLLSLTVVSLGMLGLVGWYVTSRSDGARRFPVTGVVIELTGDGMVAIAHDAVPGFMPAMTMPFALAEPGDEERLTPGDRVQFSFRVEETGSRAEDVVVTGRDLRVLEAHRAARARPAARVRPGDQVPAFSLVDQMGAPLSERNLLGQRTVLTFIFTRCPVPEFCPRINGRFRELQRAIEGDASLDDVRLLSVTLDPEHDTPAVLGAYGRAMGADVRRWRFATGRVDQVTALTRAFAVHTETSGAELDHTLATALLDEHGRVVEIWRGNMWEAREVLAVLRPLAR